MPKEILDEIQELFFLELESKTGWGKNDIKQLYKDCVLEVLKRRL
jgi:hypothetical protein